MIRSTNGLRLGDTFRHKGKRYWALGFPTRQTVCGLKRNAKKAGKIIKFLVKDVEKVEK